ncbi:MAG: VOC family protein [Candidatus Gracilibacteria bacterium]
MNGPSYFEVQVDEPERAMSFYTEVFGWKFHKDEHIPMEYWRIQTDGTHGGMMKRPMSKPANHTGANAFVCSMVVDDFNAVSEKITTLGGMVVLPKFAVPGLCWQGYFADTEGNTFGLYQPDENAK